MRIIFGSSGSFPAFIGANKGACRCVSQPGLPLSSVRSRTTRRMCQLSSPYLTTVEGNDVLSNLLFLMVCGGIIVECLIDTKAGSWQSVPGRYTSFIAMTIKWTILTPQNLCAGASI